MNRGRPPIAEEDRRNGHIKVMVTDAEREALENAANAAGVGVSTWMRLISLEMTRTQGKTTPITHIRIVHKNHVPPDAAPQKETLQRKPFELLPLDGPGRNLNGQKIAKLRKELGLKFEIVAMRLSLTKMNIYGIERGLLIPRDESAWDHWMNWIRHPSPLEETDVIPSKPDRVEPKTRAPDRRAHTRYL